MAINTSSTGSTVYTSSATATWYTGTGTSTSTSIGTCAPLIDVSVYDSTNIINGDIEVLSNSNIKLPDGTIIEVDKNGNFKIEDKDSKVVYKSNSIREFNKYMNASDLLEDFIEDLGKANVKQGEVLAIPIEMFINWIIHKSAEQDGDEIPKDIPSLEDNSYKHPRCKCCGKFIKKEIVAKGLYFCNGSHYQKYMEKI